LLIFVFLTDELLIVGLCIDAVYGLFLLNLETYTLLAGLISIEGNGLIALLS